MSKVLVSSFDIKIAGLIFQNLGAEKTENEGTLKKVFKYQGNTYPTEFDICPFESLLNFKEYHGYNAFVLIYDNALPESFQTTLDLITKINEAKQVHPYVLVIGNKKGSKLQASVSIKDMAEIVKKYPNTDFLEVFANSGLGVNEAFEYLIKRVHSSDRFSSGQIYSEMARAASKVFGISEEEALTKVEDTRNTINGLEANSQTLESAIQLTQALYTALSAGFIDITNVLHVLALCDLDCEKVEQMALALGIKKSDGLGDSLFVTFSYCVHQILHNFVKDQNIFMAAFLVCKDTKKAVELSNRAYELNQKLAQFPSDVSTVFWLMSGGDAKAVESIAEKMLERSGFTSEKNK